MFIQKLLIPFLILAASLGGLLLILKTPLAGIIYHNAIAHSFLLLIFVAVLFFVYFFSYQNYAKEKDIRWYILGLAFFVWGVFTFANALIEPDFGWGNETLCKIADFYGPFLTSLILLGLIIPFSDRLKDKIYQARFKIFLSISFILLATFVCLFFSPLLSQALYSWIHFFAGLTGINLFLLLVILFLQKEDNFFTSSLPKVLVLLTVATISSLFYQEEWNLAWWYFQLLGFSAVLLLLLLLLRAKKGKNITEILFSSFSIRARLFFIVGLTLVAIVGNGLIDFRLSQNHLKVQTLENLVLMADMQEGQVLNYLDKIKDRTADFSSDGFTSDSLKKILYGDKQAVTDLSRYLLENKQPVDPNIFGIHIMDINGKVVASSRGSEIGMEDMAMEEVFIQAKGSRYATAHLSDIVEDVHFGEKNIAIMAIAPIIDQTKMENIGVIMLFFKTGELSDILTGKAQSQFGALSTWTSRKKTMEMYLVNEDKLMLNDSRFILNTPLKQKVDTLPVRLCAKSEEMSGEYLGYQGVSVFGASMCFSNGWTLLTEINKDEALATLGEYLQQNLLSASATFLIILIVMYLFIIGITSPLKALSEAAQKIGKGDFTTRSALITRDEFGELGAVFNQMAENIQKGSAGLEQKAKEEEVGRLAMSNILGDLEIAKSELEQAKAKDEAILGSIGDAVMACDKDGRVMLFNGVAEALTGFSAKETIGRHYNQVLKLVRESDEKTGDDFIAEAIKTGQATKMANHTLLIAKDGRRIPVADSAAPVKDAKGNLVGCVVVFRDVTHEREVDKAKTEFVSLASHQLRTPLSTINWYSEMLLSGDAGVINENQKKYLEETYKASQRMVALVNSLLNVSRIELGTFAVDPKPTDPVEVAKICVKDLQPQIKTKKLVLKEEYVSKNITFPADVKLLGIIFQNLLSNAVKYTPDKGHIILTIEKKDPDLLIKVADTGMGIPEKQQNRIFEKLFRGDNIREMDAEGTGLGLYLVKAIVIHAGGKIWFESKEGGGTTFYITLPLSGMSKKEGNRELS